MTRTPQLKTIAASTLKGLHHVSLDASDYLCIDINAGSRVSQQNFALEQVNQYYLLQLSVVFISWVIWVFPKTWKREYHQINGNGKNRTMGMRFG